MANLSCIKHPHVTMEMPRFSWSRQNEMGVPHSPTTTRRQIQPLIHLQHSEYSFYLSRFIAPCLATNQVNTLVHSVHTCYSTRVHFIALIWLVGLGLLLGKRCLCTHCCVWFLTNKITALKSTLGWLLYMYLLPISWSCDFHSNYDNRNIHRPMCFGKST